jgi:hypothetical protein
MPYIGKSPSAAVRQRYQYTATAGQTTFSGTDTANLTLTYTDNNFVDVFQNGVLLKGGTTDYTATSGTSVVLTTGASVSDVIEIIVYDVFSVGNFYSRTDSDSRYVNVDGDTMTGTLALNVSGSSHLTTTTAGTSNFVLGVNAGNSIESGGNYNVAIGDEAGTAITTADKTTVVGYRAGKAINTGNENTFIGYQAGQDVTTGVTNVAIGTATLNAETTGNNSIAIGYGALKVQNNTGGASPNNIAVGYDAGSSITTGANNTIVGSLAGDAMTDAANCVAIGLSALTTNTRGNKVVAVGVGAGRNFNYSSGNSDMNNVFVGHNAGEQVTVGGNCVIIGSGACANAAGITGGADLTTGNNHVVIGKDAAVSAADADAQVVLGFECVGASNTSLTFGKAATDSNIDFGATSITAPSDERYKENIETSTAGLGFINDLRPVTYKWKKAKDIPSDHRAYIEEGKDGAEDRVMERGDDLYHGFIAQEIKVALDKHSEVKNYKELWREDNDGRQRVGPAFLIPMLTKAVQELSAKNDALEARIKKLEDG